MASKDLIGNLGNIQSDLQVKGDPHNLRLVNGAGSYVEDRKLPGMLHLAFTRSPFAHAEIKRVDATEALKRRGVVGVLTAKEIVEKTLPWPFPTSGTIVPDLAKARSARTYSLAAERTTYVGEAVAAVVCDNRYACEDAAEAVRVEYEPLQPVSDPEEAALPGSALVYGDWGTNVLFEERTNQGNVREAFAKADLTADVKISIPRQAGGAIEPRAILAEYLGNDRIRLHSQTKSPFDTMRLLAAALRKPSTAIEVLKVDVGGNFGPKGLLYPEDIVVALTCLETKSPVKWVATRMEDFLSTWQGRGQVHRARVAFNRDGKILGMKSEIYIDTGAYWMTNTISLARTFGLLTGCYRIENFEFNGYCVVTNKVPFGPVRGNGRPEAILFTERVMDVVAGQLGLDPAVVRRRNFVPSEEMPYRTGTGSTLDVGDLEGALETTLAAASYDELRAKQRSTRSGRMRQGIGIGCYVEDTGGVGFETAEVSLREDGAVSVHSGAAPSGQGVEQVLGEVAANELGLAAGDAVVTCGETRVLSDGRGTFASRSTAVAGSAVKIASERLRGRILDYAAKILAVDQQELALGGGSIRLRGRRRLTLRNLAARAGREGELEKLKEKCSFNQGRPTFSFGVHVAVVEVDMESFAVKVKEYYALDDAGKIISLPNIEGQVFGGVMHGLGGALLEDMVFNAEASPIAMTFADYGIPTAAEQTSIESIVTETPSRLNPLGVRGVGEGGTIGALSAVTSAVLDAVDPGGSGTLMLPLTPDRLWKINLRRSVPLG